MSTPNAQAITREILQELFGHATDRVSVRLWDDSCWPDDNPRGATLVLNHPGALRAMFLPGDEVSLGEGYLYGDFDVEGDLETVYGAAEHLLLDPPPLTAKLKLAQKLRLLPDVSLRLAALQEMAQRERGRARVGGTRHSLKRDRAAVTYHYDVSNDFYALWQDPYMVYSCAYFESPEEDLDPAQARKLDYI